MRKSVRLQIGDDFRRADAIEDDHRHLMCMQCRFRMNFRAFPNRLGVFYATCDQRSHLAACAQNPNFHICRLLILAPTPLRKQESAPHGSLGLNAEACYIP